jgi:hypothetical protein
MAHHRFVEAILEGVVSAKEEVLISESAIHEQVPGQHPTLPANDGVRINVGKWEMFDADTILEMVRHYRKEGLSGLTNGYKSLSPEGQSVLKTFGVVQTTTGYGPAPDYILHENGLYAIDRELAATNMMSVVMSGLNQRGKQHRNQPLLLSCEPLNDTLASEFSPKGSILRRASLNAEQKLDKTSIIKTSLMNTYKSIHVNGEEGMINSAAIMTDSVMEAVMAIKKLKVLSRFSNMEADPKYNIKLSNKTDAFNYLRPNKETKEYEPAYRNFMARNKQVLVQLFETATKVFVKHHGYDGLKTEEAGAIRKVLIRNHSTAEATKAQAPGGKGKGDKVLSQLQLLWWHYEVTGWYAAYIWAANMTVLLVNRVTTLDAVVALTEWVFARSTYRKLVAGDQLLDATRDIHASEVTQAATTTIMWQRTSHPVILALDDLEFTVTRAKRGDLLRQAYDDILRHLAGRLGEGYGEHVNLDVGAPIGQKQMTASYAGPASTGVLYGKVNVGSAGAEIAHCEVSESDAVLMSICKDPKPIGLYNEERRGEKVMMVGTKLGELYATYMMPETLSGRGRDKAYVFLCGMHFREDKFKYPLPLLEWLDQYKTKYVPRTTEERVAKLHALLDPVTTQKHHRHISMLSLLNTCGHAWTAAMDTMLEWEDATNTFASAMLIAMASLPPELITLQSHWNVWGQSSTEAEYIKNAKAATTKLKALDNQVRIGDHEVDLSPLFEWEVLRHRATIPSKMDAEIRDRRDLTQQIGIGRSECKQELVEIFQDISRNLDKRAGDGKSPLSQEWDEFYENRVQLTPSGSAFTVDEDMLEKRRQLKANGIQDLTKTQVMAAMEDGMTLDDALDQEPRIIANASWKHEWSKVRTLFAASMEHWLVAAFALGPIEEYLPADCPIGKAADAGAVCAKIMRMSREGVVACIDAANFNILHKHDLMAQVCEVASEVLGDRLTSGQHKALKWLSKAEERQYVVIKQGDVSEELMEEGRREGWITQETKGDGKEITLAQIKLGMFSGCRYTMLYNTFFNRVYYRVAEKKAKVESQALHSGDDVYAVFKNYRDAYKMKHGLKSIDYTLQLMKCFLEGVREFLRISHKNANTTQYLARSCATAVHGRIESPSPTDFISYASATLRRSVELVVRHANRPVMLDICKVQVTGCCARWGVTNIAWVGYLKLPTILGGCAAKCDQHGRWIGFCLQRTAQTRGDTVKYLSGLPGVKMASRHLVEQLGIKMFHRRVSEAIAAAIAPKGVIMNYGIVLRWMTRRDVDHMHHVSGKLAYIRQSREFILAKAAGLFNTLAINLEYWGNITGILSGIATTWYPTALAFALGRQTDAAALGDRRMNKLDDKLSAVKG